MPEAKRSPILSKPAMSAALVLLLVSLALIAGACGGSDAEDTDIANGEMSSTTSETPSSETTSSEGTDATVVTDTTAAPTTAAPTTSTTLASTEWVLANGNITSLGYIDDVWVDAGTRYLSIDYCDLEGELDTGDYEIINESSRLRTWTVSDSAHIITATRWFPNESLHIVEERPCTWSDFLSFWGPGPFFGENGNLHTYLWNIERDGDMVVKIWQQYLP